MRDHNAGSQCITPMLWYMELTGRRGSNFKIHISICVPWRLLVGTIEWHGAGQNDKTRVCGLTWGIDVLLADKCIDSTILIMISIESSNVELKSGVDNLTMLWPKTRDVLDVILPPSGPVPAYY